MIVDTTRLILPDENFIAAFPNLGFKNRFFLDTSGEAIIVCDPICLADVYNSSDWIASLVREHGVFLMDFGGDVSCPIWWKSPFAVFPLSAHFSTHNSKPHDTQVWAEEIYTDSGSFVFLPLSDGLPMELKSILRNALSQGDAIQLPTPAGRWELLYEQFEAPEENMNGLYRNIVMRWSKCSK